MILYPAYQVPLAYFLLALLLAFIISRKNYKLLWENKWVKLSVLAGSVISLLSLIILFYTETKETIQVITNTIYPGKRNEPGGNLQFLQLFRDNFSWFVKEHTFPSQWLNNSEVSAFLMLSPIASILIVYSWVKTKKINVLFIPLLIFQVLIYNWFFLGLPEFLAKLTMFNVCPTWRTFYIFGFSNVVFTLLYLGQFRKTAEQTTLRPKMAIIFSIIFVIALAITYSLNKQTDRFFTKAQVINGTILFAVLNWLIIYFSQSKIFQYLFYASCTLYVAANIFVNPLCVGLSPFFENKVYKTVSEIRDKDPDAQWITFGNSIFAGDFLKAAGANCLTGVQFAPPLDKLHILDPSLKNEDIYNRYAHIVVTPLTDAKDSVEFISQQVDLYTIKMDPSSPRLKQMGIKYAFFTYKPSEAEVRELVPVKDISGFYIYKRKDL
ncbi:hypothetical protein [Niastella sp. OAS944]|uniref:DUF7657 domain-containing protein n=1 Tax=Niastella sp. OAS944 TaxID=2664089 RepID=UPI0035C86C00|nr:hypothetical protein [Chitinophagaceae bacterium OAS944]